MEVCFPGGQPGASPAENGTSYNRIVFIIYELLFDLQTSRTKHNNKFIQFYHFYTLLYQLKYNKKLRVKE